MAPTAQQLDEVRAWSMQDIAASQQITAAAIAQLTPLWSTFTGWYAAAQVAELGGFGAQVAQAAAETAAGVGSTYITEVLAALGTRSVPSARVRLEAPRRGADLVKVYSRPASEYRLAFALSGDPAQAATAAGRRLQDLVRDDVVLGRREGQQRMMRRAGVQQYMRLLHPELAVGGSCGLCVAASDRAYKTGQLLPMHGGCNCEPVPLATGMRPGDINNVDLARVYDAAGGSNKAADLKRTRFRVDQHGELGPVLTDAAHRFQGPGDPDNVDAGARARRRLAAAEPVLQQLLDSAEPTDPALRFQERFVEQMRRTAAAA